MVFVFSRCLFKVFSSRSIKFVLSENRRECFFLFYRFALHVFLLFSICFFSFILTLFFPELYNNLYTKTTLNLVTLVSHSQEIGDKKKQRALWCYNARSVTNHIADFLLLILQQDLLHSL